MNDKNTEYSLFDMAAAFAGPDVYTLDYLPASTRNHIPGRRPRHLGNQVARASDGPFKAPAVPGRNQLCPCDSGKKYKKCCGK